MSTKTVTERDFDEQGRCVREVVTVTEESAPVCLRPHTDDQARSTPWPNWYTTNSPATINATNFNTGAVWHVPEGDEGDSSAAVA